MAKERRIAIMLDLAHGYARHTELFAGTQRFAAKQGNWDCIIDEIADHQLPVDGRGPIPYDGVIARANRRLVQRAGRCGIPVVNTLINSPARSVPSVFVDWEAEGRIAAEHLLDRGLRSFACIGLTPDKASDLEERGFVDCLNEAGFECETARLKTNEPKTPIQWRQMERTLSEYIDRWKPPVGVFLMIDTHARMLVQMCKERGLRMPEDVALIVNLDEPQRCEYPPPSLTSIKLGYEQSGYEAAALLERMMDGEPAPAEPILIPPVGLRIRQSTDFHVVDDPLVAEALRYISANSPAPIGVDDIAQAVSTSRTTLQSKFKDQLGRSVAAEIRRLRIERAKRQLTSSDSRIVDVAAEVGFVDQHRMNEVFRRELGMTPTQYRRKHT